MDLGIPAVWSDDHRRHEPGGEIYVGVATPGTEVPERAERIREALAGAGASIVPATQQGDDELRAVHDDALLDYLASAWERWSEAGLERDPGQDRVVPYLFPGPAWVDVQAIEDVASPAALAGRFAYDTMTLIGPGTWRAARAAIDTALTAADLAAGGEPIVYACCRPPGHHATRTAFGGSCYLNNSAVAAERLRRKMGGPVAVLDIDAHHGNGAQSVFYRDPDVSTGSVHVDPASGWFPHYLGTARETGEAEGHGANLNLPLAPGAGDDVWLGAVRELAAWGAAATPTALVVALGVDAAGGDPESPLEVTESGYEAAGAVLAGLDVPTVFVQEGGYDLARIGALVTATLRGAVSGGA